MKANWKKLILPLILLLFIFHGCGIINLHYYNMSFVYRTGKGSMQDGLLAGKNYSVEIEWKEGLHKIGDETDVILVKETSREGLGWNIYRPFKKSAIAIFEFDIFEKNKNKFLGKAQIANTFEMKGIASGNKFKERVKVFTLRRLMDYINEKCYYIDSDIKKEESSRLDCKEVYTFSIDGWDNKMPNKFKREICFDHIDSIQIDTFLFQAHDAGRSSIEYHSEVLTLHRNEKILIEVKRFLTNGQLGFEGYYEGDEEYIEENSWVIVPLEPTGIWRTWNPEGEETKSWDFKRMERSKMEFY